MADDNVKEILGFDPGSSQRTEAREDFKVIVPSEIQEEFKKWNRGRKGIVRPDYLMYSRERTENRKGWIDTLRDYYAYQGKIEYQGSDGKVNEIDPFQATSRLHIQIRVDPNHGYEYVGIGQHGEPGDSKGPEQAFSNLTLDTRFGIGHQRYTGDGYLYLGFDPKDGRLVSLRFDPVSGSGHGILVNNPSNEKFEMSRESGYGRDWIKAKKHLSKFRKLFEEGEIIEEDEDYRFEVTYDDREQLIVLKVMQNGSLKDTISIPEQVLLNNIRDNIINPLTLKNPINAPPELDLSWRFANLSEVLGIKWERH